MEVLIPLVFDILVIAAVWFYMRRASKRGFLRTVIQMAAYIAVIIASSLISQAAAPMIYQRIVEPSLQNSIQEKTQETGETIYELMPDKFLSRLGVTQEDLDNLLESVSPEELLEKAADETIAPLVTSIIGMLVFVACFALLSMVASGILSALKIINYIPGLGALNSLLGGAIGILQGLLMVYVFAILLHAIFGMYPDGWWLFTEQSAQNSYLFSRFYRLNLLEAFYL